MKAKQYLESVIELLKRCDDAQLDVAVDLVEATVRAGRTIFVAGNGGSAATANHFAADFGKNVVKGDEGRPRIMTLTSHISAITAYGNDEGYEKTISRQLTNWVEEGDLVILISASGNSPNVIDACELAHKRGAKIIGMSGFSGGKLMQMSDICLHADDRAYETVEDAHSVFCHLIVSAMKDRMAK